MALTLEQFIAASGAELVADRLIVGTMGDRRFVGDIIDGVFNLNEEGKALMAELDASPAAKPRKQKADKAVADDTPAETQAAE